MMMECPYLVDCAEASLGSLSPAAWLHGRSRAADTGAIIVNGVEIPRNVAEQLRRLGLPLSWYNQGELEDAVEACAYDCTLVDDAAGTDFRDMLHLSDDERKDAFNRSPMNNSTFVSRYSRESERRSPWEPEDSLFFS